ncbi:MAG TPA: hypothetical protein VKU01_23345 [Bryobacteraceae bacterium]|nr:hypothetical protein [Bryobacteraceae bacterium]
MNDIQFQKVVAELATALSRSAPTAFFNEGNLLSLILSGAERNPSILPLAVDAAKWFREAIPKSPFSCPPGRPKEAVLKWYEGATKIDGVIGDFERHGKAGITLAPNGSRLIAIEAKLGSTFSEDVRHASYWDQAARSMTCLAYMAVQAGWQSRRDAECAFYVFAPDEMIATGIFAECLDRTKVVEKIERRISDCPSDEKRTRFHSCKYSWINFLLSDRMAVGAISWETVVAEIKHVEPCYGDAVSSFYLESLAHNEVSRKVEYVRRRMERASVRRLRNNRIGNLSRSTAP